VRKFAWSAQRWEDWLCDEAAGGESAGPGGEGAHCRWGDFLTIWQAAMLAVLSTSRGFTPFQAWHMAMAMSHLGGRLNARDLYGLEANPYFHDQING